MSKHWYVKVVAAVVAIGGFALGAASQAGAVIVPAAPGHPALSYAQTLGEAAPSGASAPSPGTPSQCSNISRDCVVMGYHNGPVQHNVVEYFIYWEPSNDPTPYPAPYEAGLTTWLNDVAAASGTSGNVFAVADQYYDTLSGAASYIPYSVTNGGEIVAADPLPSTDCTRSAEPAPCITQADIQAEIKNVIEGHGLPENLNTEYVLFRPPGSNDCISTSSSSPCLNLNYCAYHSQFSGTSGPIVFANDPYLYGTSGCDGNQFFNLGYPNGPSDPYIDPVISTLSHELLETITDPQPGSGWFDGDTGHEIGDKCAYNYNGSAYGSGSGLANNGHGDYNQTINGHQYLMQTEFSNANSNTTTLTGCIPTAPPTAAITGVPASPPLTQVPVPIDGSTSTDSLAEPLTYTWDFGDGTTGTGATPGHTYAHAGTYKVKLVVQDAAHFVDTTTATVTIADRPPAATFTGPTSVVTGSPASFSGTGSSDPDGSVTAYAWNFGDGSTGTGAALSHIFTRAGAHTVTLTVTDDSGSGSAPTSQQVTVLPKPLSVKSKLTESARGSVGVPVQNQNGFPVTGNVTLAAGSLKTGKATRAITIGKKRFSAGANKKVTVKVKLSKAARNFLKSHKRLKVKLTLVVRASGESNTTSKTGSIKAAPATRHDVNQPVWLSALTRL